MWEAGQLRISAADVLARLETVAQDSDVAAAMLRIQLLSGGGKVVTDNLSTILGRQLYAELFRPQSDRLHGCFASGAFRRGPRPSGIAIVWP